MFPDVVFDTFPAVRENGRYYCRAANTVLEDSVRFCYCCPLNADGQDFQCQYYSDERAQYYTPDQQMEYQRGNIAMGLTGHFPDFAGEGQPVAATMEAALRFAAEAHLGGTRKGTDTPYIVHPMEAAVIAASITENPDIIAAAALHDVLEDTAFGEDDILDSFGPAVLALVQAESEDKREHMAAEDSWQVRKEETLRDLETAEYGAQVVALCDKLSNMRQMKRDYDSIGDRMWQKFNQKDKTKHGWYYGSIGEILQPVLGETAAMAEYLELVEYVFG